MQVALLRNIVNRRPFLNVYIIERLALSHIFYFNRYNSCLSPCIFVVFIIFVIYNPHGAGVDGLQHRLRHAGEREFFWHEKISFQGPAAHCGSGTRTAADRKTIQLL